MLFRKSYLLDFQYYICTFIIIVTKADKEDPSLSGALDKYKALLKITITVKLGPFSV